MSRRFVWTMARAGGALCIVASLFLYVSCSPTDGPGEGDGTSDGDDLSGVTARIQINTDPDDPMIGQLIGVERGDTLVFFGQKDAEGVVRQIESMQYYAPGATEPHYIQLDADVRPIFMTGPAGEVATLTYEGDAVSVTFKDASGAVSVESFTLASGGAARAKAQYEQVTAAIRSASQMRVAAQTPTTVQLIVGKLTVNLQSGGTSAGTIKDAKVTVTATNAQGFVPVAFNPSTNQYEFTIAHRVADLQVLIADCQKVTGDTSAAFTVAGFGMAVLAAACLVPGPQTPFCAFLLGFGGAIVGTGVGGASLLATGANYACDDLILTAAAQSGQGRQSVNIQADIPSLNQGAATVVQYDLFNPADPIAAAKTFSTAVTISVNATITDVRTVPTAPAAGESYSVVFSFVPANASVSYTISGTDAFSFSETLTGDGVSGMVTGSSIPGGAQGVTDAIVAQILVNGSAVGSSTQIAITFH